MKNSSIFRGISLCILFLATATSAPAFENGPIGWASYDTVANPDSTQTPAVAGTTGGAGGTVVTVTNETDLRKWAGALNPDGTHPTDVAMFGPYIIQVQGTIALTDRVDIMPNRTVIGIGTDPTITGANLRVRGAGTHPGYNVIIRNLILRNHTTADKDGITIQDNAHHVWVDHCDISTCNDGACDVTHASDYVTISWTRFHDQDKTCLLGHSDNAASEDTGHLKVTYHHNYFGAVQRQPRVRFSFLAHVFNNFYAGLGYPTASDENNYGIASACDAYVLVEGNYFKDQQHPMLCIAYSGTPNGWLVERYNVFNNCGPIEVNPPVAPAAPMPEPSTYYTYTLDPTADIMDIVTAGAGVNKIYLNTEPPTPSPMTWATPPHAASYSSIAMVATTAIDPNGVEYYFHCTTSGGHDSAWQDSTSYTDNGLTPNTTYTYQVKARDKSLMKNATGYSTLASATTDTYDDMIPPAPNPMTWLSLPKAGLFDSVTMTATTATDVSGVQYYFVNVTDPSHNSSWQDSSTYTDTGLANDVSYTYQVKARDKSAVHNETALSAPASVTTSYFPPISAPAAYWMFDETAGTVAHDSTGNGNEGTLQGTTLPVWAAGKYGNCLTFAAGGSKVYVPSSPTIDFADHDLSVSLWVKQPVSFSGQYELFIKGTIGSGTYTGSGKRYEIFRKDSTFRFAVDDDVTKSEVSLGTADFCKGDTWVHVVGVRDTVANQLRLYADGVLKGTVTDATGSISQTEPLNIGDGVFPGSLDDVRIYPYALSQDQITAIYSGAGLPDTTAPTPVQMTWATPPHATGISTIAMTAVTASDISGVEYFFANLTDPNHNSGWQTSASFTDSGLANNTQYVYTVIARDKSSNHNENAWSEQASATTPRYVCPTAITGDVNGDCQVDFTDYAAIANSWAGNLPMIDPNDDNITDFFDMMLFAADWLTCNRDPSGECWQ
jgi:pectate lyase